MPVVSVIVPVRNAAPYLKECLDSILCQSLTEFELICIDDASTDDSCDMLLQEAALDARIQVLKLEGRGAGAARNIGLREARGDFVVFLDADDIFHPNLLASSVRQCMKDDADMGVFRAQYFHTDKQCCSSADHLLKTKLLPQKRPFNWMDMPEHILDFVSPAPWNKIFKRSFLLEQGLFFQEIRRANDYYLTKMALLRAQRITLIDEVLVSYRVGNAMSLQSSNGETPFEFFKAIDALKSGIASMGIEEPLERSFVNTAVSTCIQNLESIRDLDVYRSLYGRLKVELLPRIGAYDRPLEFYYYKKHHERVGWIQALTCDEYMFAKMSSLQDELRECLSKKNECRRQLALLKEEGRVGSPGVMNRVGAWLAGCMGKRG